MHGSVTEFAHSILQKEANMSQQPILLETLTTGSRDPVEDNQNSINARPPCLPMAGVTRMLDNGRRKEVAAGFRMHELGKHFLKCPIYVIALKCSRPTLEPWEETSWHSIL
jgi:hypothetical protein